MATTGFEEAVEAFGDRVVLKSNIGTDADLELFYKYRRRSKFIVVDVTTSESVPEDLKVTKKVTKRLYPAFLCKLTNGEPKEVCQNLEEIINQI